MRHLGTSRSVLGQHVGIRTGHAGKADSRHDHAAMETSPPWHQRRHHRMGAAWSGVGGLLMGLTQILMDAISGYAPLNVQATLVFATAC